MKNEQLLLKIQAMVDNELPEQEIPEVLSQIEANYEYRDEYIKLLQLKKRLAGVSFPSLPKAWFEQFEKKKSKKITMILGTIIVSLTGISWIVGEFFNSLNWELPSFWSPLLIASMIAGGIFFLIHSILQRKQEKKTKSYEEIMQ